MENIKLDIIETQQGEYICSAAIEIKTIPHMDILSESGERYSEIGEKMRARMGNMLSEFYYNYRTLSITNPMAEMSVELLLVTEPVENQPYKANIKMFVVFRGIDSNKAHITECVSRAITSCEMSLKLDKYSIESVATDDVLTSYRGVTFEKASCIVKEERVEELRNEMLPKCYAYDVMCAGSNELSSLMLCLTNNPRCAVSFQLTPTVLRDNEKFVITNTAQSLDILSKGVMTQGIGNISLTSASKLSEAYRYYQDRKNSPLFLYGITVYGTSASVDDIASKIIGQLSYTAATAPELKQLFFDGGYFRPVEKYAMQTWLINDTLMSNGRNAQIWSSGEYGDYYRLSNIISAEEATEFFRLPIGSSDISAGFSVNKTEITSKTYSKDLINAGDIVLGKLKSTYNDSIGIKLNDLAKHMLVVGTPGSGKTTFSVGLLDRLWKEHGIPFLVIEPAKNEYRALVESIPEIQVFTPGKNHISPFLFNPFIPPKNVKLETYKSTLKTAFAAAVSMTSPLDKIFEEAINNCYSDFGWLDSYTVDDKGKIFSIADFIKCFQETFDRIGYTGDAKNIGRAGTVRLKSLVNLFDNYNSIPIEDLLKKPTIIELAAIENSDQKALIISLLLLSVLAYVNSNYVGEGGLKNVILLEEAHVLLDAESNTGDANPSAIAQNLVKRMLAEIRSYGVGLVIADQSPRKVTTDVVGLTDMKVVFRLVEASDKQIISDSMNMTEGQTQRLARLKPGEAFLFFNKLDDPEEIITPNYRLENKISISLSDSGIKELSTYWDDKAELLRPYTECEYVRSCEKKCDFERRLLAKEIARRIFMKYITVNGKDTNEIRNVFAHITKLVIGELNGEAFSKELLLCVKCHLWRKIKYETQLKVSDKTIENSLMK